MSNKTTHARICFGAKKEKNGSKAAGKQGKHHAFVDQHAISRSPKPPRRRIQTNPTPWRCRQEAAHAQTWSASEVTMTLR
jgi:hypothetical protein